MINFTSFLSLSKEQPYFSLSLMGIDSMHDAIIFFSLDNPSVGITIQWFYDKFKLSIKQNKIPIDKRQ
jgi:hypothetical protein